MRGSRGVALELVGEKKWARLRATLPPRPDSTRVRPYSQRISLGISALTPDGRRRIKALQRRLESQILEGTFSWAEWGHGGETPKDQQTVAELIEGLAAHKAATRPISPRAWLNGYEQPLRRLLPQDRPLTPEAIAAALQRTPAGSASRKRDLTALRALAAFAGVEVDFAPYRHRYGRKRVRLRELPSDKEIEAFIDRLDRPDLRWAVGTLAAYGLRPSELSGLDLLDFPRARVHPGRKTGERVVLPLPAAWATRWDLASRPPTRWNMESPQLVAHNIRHHLRDRGWRWQIYDLRHCWARRCAETGIQPAVAARLMGHTATEHLETYQQFIGEAAWLQMFEDQAYFSAQE